MYAAMGGDARAVHGRSERRRYETKADGDTVPGCKIPAPLAQKAAAYDS